ncbi:MAG: hypothetical protein GY820_04835 [Gammaproteobacteria bacterium]|nr:hypothetical protein [Gammaproteobacteria bacterium]
MIQQKPRPSRKERKWLSSSTLNTWREKDVTSIRESQLKDLDLKAIIDLLKHKPYEMGNDSLIGYFLRDGVLYIMDEEGQDNLVVPSKERSVLLWEFHSAPSGGHFGWKKMASAIRRAIYDVRN